MGQYRKSVLPGYRQSLPKYQNAGETADPLWEDIVEIIDPTGVSSYDDVYRTFKNPNSKWYDKALSIAGALPIVGKFGKAAKLAGEGVKAAKAASELSKIQKAGRAIKTAAKTVAASKPVQKTVKALTPVAYFDKNISPLSRFTGAVTERALQNANPITKGIANFGSLNNQTTRFWKAADAFTGMREPAQKQMGGDAYDGIYNNYLNPTDMYFYAVGGAPNNPGFNALPDYVQRKIIANMMYGGSKMKHYQDGGEDNEDYEPYSYDEEETYYPTNMDEYAPSEGQMVAGAAFDTQPNYGMVGPQIPVGYTPQPAAPQYSGVSIVDYLNQNPSAGRSDYASRKQLAEQLGIKGYRGTAQQNLQMLAMLQGKPYKAPASGKKSAGRTPKATKEEIEAYNEAQGKQNPYIAIDPKTGKPYAFSEGIVEGTGSDESSSFAPWGLGLAGAAGLGGLGYGAYKMYGRGAKVPKGALPMGAGVGQKLLPSSEMARAAQFRSNVNAGKSVLSDITKKGFYTVDDLKALKNAGYKNIEGIMSQFPKGAANAFKTAAEIKRTADAGKKASSFGKGAMNALREAYAVARATPAFKFLRREDGGSTYSNGVFYDMGGGYPYGGNVYGQQMGQPLPQYMYGMGMQDGGSAQEMYVTPEEMEMLRQQGYDFDVIG